MDTANYDELIQKLGDKQQAAFLAIAAKAVSLGYKPRKDRTKTPAYSFVSGKYRQTILRIIDDGKRVFIRIKFYGAPRWSEEFDQALKRTIEESNFRYTGCYGCGRCPGAPVGYHIRYDDGRQYFRCGMELIEFHDLDDSTLGEAERLLELQTGYWEARMANLESTAQP